MCAKICIILLVVLILLSATYAIFWLVKVKFANKSELPKKNTGTIDETDSVIPQQPDEGPLGNIEELLENLYSETNKLEFIQKEQFPTES